MYVLWLVLGIHVCVRECVDVCVCVCRVVSGYYDGLTRQQPGSSACCMEAASLSLFRRENSPER